MRGLYYRSAPRKAALPSKDLKGGALCPLAFVREGVPEMLPPACRERKAGMSSCTPGPALTALVLLLQ